MHPQQATALISTDGPDPIRVPVVSYLRTLPYYQAEQAFRFHADDCEQCSGESVLPCPVGGELGDRAWNALMYQRHTARLH